MCMGGVRFFMLNGHVSIESKKVERGMIKLGINGDSFNLFTHGGFVQLADAKAKLVFEGPCRIAVNAIIRVIDGELRMGQYTRIGTDAKVICNGADIRIGEFTGITFGCVVMNSGFHYFYDETKQAYHNRSANIVIGAYNWIGNRSTISAGCITKDYTIVCSNSLLNKDYTKIDGEHPMLGGAPAKLIKTGMKRVFSPRMEVKISEYFNEHPHERLYYSEELEDDAINIRNEM